MFKFIIFILGLCLIPDPFLTILLLFLGLIRFLISNRFIRSFYCSVIRNFGWDNYRWGFISLTLYVSILMILARFINFYEVRVYTFYIIVLNFILVMAFSTFNLMFFYVLFEASLIPILLIIIGWGYQPERVEARYYLLFYTLVASIPLLLGLLGLRFS
jgi:NADH-ubiquinone oxidoreductase chain 4